MCAMHACSKQMLCQLFCDDEGHDMGTLERQTARRSLRWQPLSGQCKSYIARRSSRAILLPRISWAGLRQTDTEDDNLLSAWSVTARAEHTHDMAAGRQTRHVAAAAHGIVPTVLPLPRRVAM